MAHASQFNPKTETEHLSSQADLDGFFGTVEDDIASLRDSIQISTMMLAKIQNLCSPLEFSSLSEQLQQVEDFASTLLLKTQTAMKEDGKLRFETRTVPTSN